VPVKYVDKKVKLYSGELEALYDNNYALKLKQHDGVSRISTIDTAAEIIKDGKKIKLDEVKVGSIIACVERASNIVKIYVTNTSEINNIHDQIKQGIATEGLEIVEDSIDQGALPSGVQIPNANAGKIIQILISDVNKIMIQTSSGEKTTYILSPSCQIVSSGVSYTIYDLRLTQTVNITASNLTASRIEVSSSNKEYSTRAKIDLVNKEEGYIRVISTDDNTVIDKIYIDKNTSIYDPTAGEILSISDIAKGKSAFIVITEQSIVRKVAKSITLLED
jgi:hypothetical protein